MATLTVQSVNKLGVDLEYEQASEGGDTASNDGRTIFLFANADGGGTRTVTIKGQAAPAGMEIQDIEVTIPAGGQAAAGPFRPRFFNNQLGAVELTYNDETELTVLALRVR
jgi:hypothetical protein